MPVEIKDLLETIGFKAEDLTKVEASDVKAFMDEKFVSREYAPKDEKIKNAVFGKTVGSIRSKIKQLGEFEQKDVDGQDIEPLLDKLHGKWSTDLKVAKESNKEGKDKKVADLEKILEDKDKSLNSYKTALQEKEAKIEEITTNYTDGLRSYKTKHKLDEIKGRLPFIEDYSKKEVLRTGFEALIGTKAKFILNEKDELEVFTPDGNPIKHPKKTGEFLKPDEFIYQLAEEQGLVKKNNATNDKKPIYIPNFTDNENVNGNGNQQRSKVNPKARANERGARA